MKHKESKSNNYFIEKGWIKMKESRKTKFIRLMTWWIQEVFKIGVISSIVTIGWQQLELYILGEIRPNDVDTIVGLVLTVSLYMHVKRDYKWWV